MRQTGSGKATIEMDGGDIEASGVATRGLYATTINTSNTEKVSITFNEGNIQTDGVSSTILAETAGLGDVAIQMTGGSVVAENSTGLNSAINNVTSMATVSAVMTGGIVETSSTSAGGSKAGIYLIHRGAGGEAIVTLQNDSRIDANGGSPGIFLFFTNDAISYDVNIEDTAEVKGIGGISIGGAGLNASGTIDIAFDATVDGSTYGGGTFGYAISGNDGGSTVTVAGTVKGSIRLAGGDDTLNLLGHAAETAGDIPILDGGVGVGVDTLYFGNVAVSFDGNDIKNWENIEVEAGTLSIDGVLSVGDVLTLGGTINLQDGDTDDVIAVGGNYNVSIGSIQLDSVLNNGVGGGLSDVLNVTGDTSGTTTLIIANAGGTGAATGTGDTDGILVVEVDGASNGSFVLSAPLTVGGFTYSLHKSAGGDWYLQSPLAVCTPLGDANGDSNVDIRDVVETINIVIAGGTGDQCSDVNVGGGINALDVMGVVDLVLEN